jgi:hypothetical protein
MVNHFHIDWNKKWQEIEAFRDLLSYYEHKLIIILEEKQNSYLL